MTTKEAIEYILTSHNSNIVNKARLARVLGITPQGLNAYLKNKACASLVVADKLKSIFNIEVTDCKYFNRVLTKDELTDAKGNTDDTNS